MLLHIGALHLDIDSKRDTIWTRIVPHIRLIYTLLLVFAIALTPNGRWLTWSVYGVAVLMSLVLSRVTIGVLLKRVAVEFVFIGVVLLGTLFRDGGEVYWSWGYLKITHEGLTVLGSVTLKAFLSLSMVNLLVLTTSIPDLIQALTIIKTPPLLVAIIASMYRYISVLVDEFTSMRRAAVSRNLMVSRGWQRLVVGNMIGSLFIRTYDRGDRIHQAMLSRGYSGSPPVLTRPNAGKLDIALLIFITIVVILGQCVYLL